MTSLLCVISTLVLSIFIALLNELALLASTNAFIPLIYILPIAVVPCAISTFSEKGDQLENRDIIFIF